MLFLAIASVLGLSSCGYTSKSTLSTANTLDLEYDALMADLEVGTDRISETIRIENTKRNAVNVRDLLDNAIYETLRKAGADALVGMQYTKSVEIEYNASKKAKIRIDVITVSGYPVYYKNFRPVPKDKTTFDVQELKPETPYVIVEKDREGNQKGYRVISTTKVKHQAVIPVKEASVDGLVLGTDEAPKAGKADKKK